VMQQLDFLQRCLVHPAQKMQQQAQHLGQLRQRLYRARPDLAQLGAQQIELMRRLRGAMQHTLERNGTRLQGSRQHLLHLDPQQVLARGYSMVRDEHGAIVSDSGTLPIGARLDITFAHGWARAELKDRGRTS